MLIFRSELSLYPEKRTLLKELFLSERIAVIHYISKQIRLKNNHAILIIHLNTQKYFSININI